MINAPGSIFPGTAHVKQDAIVAAIKFFFDRQRGNPPGDTIAFIHHDMRGGYHIIQRRRIRRRIGQIKSSNFAYRGLCAYGGYRNFDPLGNIARANYLAAQKPAGFFICNQLYNNDGRAGIIMGTVGSGTNDRLYLES